MLPCHFVIYTHWVGPLSAELIHKYHEQYSLLVLLNNPGYAMYPALSGDQ